MMWIAKNHNHLVDVVADQIDNEITQSLISNHNQLPAGHPPKTCAPVSNT
jgi:hypothetical protein